MAKALVTGGAGFIGSHVAERFLANGYEVVIADNLSSGKRANVPQGAELRELDIRSPEFAALVREGGFDVVAHLAAQIDVRKSVEDPQLDAQVNILGTLNLMEALRASPKARETRVVFSSTGGALYGDFASPPTGESAPKDPEAPYGIAKLSVELYLAYYGRVHGMQTVAVRFGNVYGPRQDPHGEAGVIAIFTTRFLEGRDVTIYGDGTQTRDYVFVGDVADGIFKAATSEIPAAGRVDARAFNIGTAVETSVNEVAETLQRLSGSPTKITYAPKRAGEIQQSCLDVSKAGDTFGWRPKVMLEEGLRETIAWATARQAAAAGAGRPS